MSFPVWKCKKPNKDCFSTKNHDFKKDSFELEAFGFELD